MRSGIYIQLQKGKMTMNKSGTPEDVFIETTMSFDNKISQIVKVCEERKINIAGKVFHFQVNFSWCRRKRPPFVREIYEIYCIEMAEISQPPIVKMENDAPSYENLIGEYIRTITSGKKVTKSIVYRVLRERAAELGLDGDYLIFIFEDSVFPVFIPDSNWAEDSRKDEKNKTETAETFMKTIRISGYEITVVVPKNACFPNLNAKDVNWNPTMVGDITLAKLDGAGKKISESTFVATPYIGRLSEFWGHIRQHLMDEGVDGLIPIMTVIPKLLEYPDQDKP